MPSAECGVPVLSISPLKQLHPLRENNIPVILIGVPREAVRHASRRQRYPLRLRIDSLCLFLRPLCWRTGHTRAHRRYAANERRKNHSVPRPTTGKIQVARSRSLAFTQLAGDSVAEAVQLLQRDLCLRTWVRTAR